MQWRPSLSIISRLIYRFSQAPFCFVCFFLVFCFCFCWQLLICENTLIQIVKLKKKQRKNSCSRWESNPVCRRERPVIFPLGHERLLSSLALILLLISFFVTSCLSAWKCWCFSWQNVFGTPEKPWLWTEKTKKHWLCYIWLETAAKSCELKRRANGVWTEPTRQIWTFRVNFTA